MYKYIIFEINCNTNQVSIKKKKNSIGTKNRLLLTVINNIIVLRYYVYFYLSINRYFSVRVRNKYFLKCLILYFYLPYPSPIYTSL